MKKFIVVALSVILVSTGLLTFFQPGSKDFALKSLSEIRYNIFNGKTDAFGATFMTGEREDPYILDGVPRELTEFGVITLLFKIPTDDFYGVPTYKLTIDDNYYEGEFEKNPFDTTYVADIKSKTSDNCQVYLLVEWNNLHETTKLEPRNIEWEYDWKKALELATDNCEDIVDKLIIDGELQAEVHVQIITDPSGLTEQYFWYISIYGTDGSSVTIVIDPQSGEVVSKRIIEY